MKNSFEFSPENQKEFQDILKRYPVKRAAFLPTLHLAQEQNGYISEAVERYVSEILDVPLIDVREVLTFYSLFHRRAPGRHHIRVCMSLSCWLRGSERIKKHLEQTLQASSGEVTNDGAFSWEAVPRLHGCLRSRSDDPAGQGLLRESDSGKNRRDPERAMNVTEAGANPSGRAEWPC